MYIYNVSYNYNVVGHAYCELVQSGALSAKCALTICAVVQAAGSPGRKRSREFLTHNPSFCSDSQNTASTYAGSHRGAPVPPTFHNNAPNAHNFNYNNNSNNHLQNGGERAVLAQLAHQVLELNNLPIDQRARGMARWLQAARALGPRQYQEVVMLAVTLLMRRNNTNGQVRCACPLH